MVGPNRSGKSTLHQALLTALFGLGREEGLLGRQEVLRWGYTGEGWLEIEYRVSSGRYRLKRNLSRADASLMRESAGEWETVCRGVEEVRKRVLAHLGVQSLSVFARTVSVAQGDLSRLESKDRQQIGSALEEVLIGESRATFTQALGYLDTIVRDRKTGLRKAADDRELRKLDKFEEDVTSLKKELAQARERQDRLEEARNKLKEIEEELPQKQNRLKELVEEGEPPGLWTKSQRKRALEERKGTLEKETRDLEALSRQARKLEEEIESLRGNVGGQEALLDQDLDKLEERLRALEGDVSNAQGDVEGCDGRIEEAKNDLRQVEEWLDERPGFRENPKAAEEGEALLGNRRDLCKGVREAEEEVKRLEREAPRPKVPSRELFLGILLLLAGTAGAWWGVTWAIVVAAGGVALVGDYTRRLMVAKREVASFRGELRVRQGILANLEGELKQMQESLREKLAALGTDEEGAEELLAQHREIRRRQQAASKLMASEESKRQEAEQCRQEAKENLRQFCVQFGVEAPEESRKRISLVRQLRGKEEALKQLLRGRSMQAIEQELTEKSVDLRGIKAKLESNEYAHFNPAAEEVEAWRREAKQLEKDTQGLQGQLREAMGQMQVLEPQVKQQATPHELEARLEWLKEVIVRGDRTVEACNEAMRLLWKVQEEHRTTYLPALEQATSGHLSRITGGFYSSVDLAQGWPDIAVADPANREVPPKQLSDGSRDQLYFAFRLAVADQLSGGEPLPFLLDEPFTNFDADHLPRALDILAALPVSGRQVIYFTMHPEIHESLERRAAGRFPVQTVCLGA